MKPVLRKTILAIIGLATLCFVVFDIYVVLVLKGVIHVGQHR
jgi:hypothetical protein